MTKEEFFKLQDKYSKLKQLRSNANKIAHLVEHGSGAIAIIDEGNGTLEIQYTPEMIKELHSLFLRQAVELESEIFD